MCSIRSSSNSTLVGVSTTLKLNVGAVAFGLFVGTVMNPFALAAGRFVSFALPAGVADEVVPVVEDAAAVVPVLLEVAVLEGLDEDVLVVRGTSAGGGEEEEGGGGEADRLSWSRRISLEDGICGGMASSESMS